MASAAPQSGRKVSRESRRSRTLARRARVLRRKDGRHAREVVSATMTTAPAAANDETGRLSALAGLEIRDSEAEPALDRVTSLAARLFRTPIALVGFIDRERQWFKSRIGVEPSEVPREMALCDDTIRGNGVSFVPDLWRDARFADKPATRQLGIRFYAGAPLVTREGHRIGTVCVMDRKPRPDIPPETPEPLPHLPPMLIPPLNLPQ